jgi:hypothetical protein
MEGEGEPGGGGAERRGSGDGEGEGETGDVGATAVVGKGEDVEDGAIELAGE